MPKPYDVVIVGAGLFGAVCAHQLILKKQRVLVLEKRSHLGGNMFTESINGIQVHRYGAHIFHTNNRKVWDYITSFAEFRHFINSPLAKCQGRLFNLPFNMNTFHQLWGVQTPAEAEQIIAEQRQELQGRTPANLEEQAIALVGRDLYEMLIKGYTEKQWGRPATELPAFIIRRLPVRFTFDNNYFTDRYQGIPVGGYTQIIENMLAGADIQLHTDFLASKDAYRAMADQVIYTGPIDQYFNYCYGRLAYRSLRFDTSRLEIPNFQGNAVVNYTDASVPYTRIIEHKHFDPVTTSHTLITYEYPEEWRDGAEPYYPVNDELNMQCYHQYRHLCGHEQGVSFGGRLAEYKYYDMHQIIESAMHLVEKL